VRARHSTITLAAKTELTLIPIGGGVHVDMDAGSLYFSAAENELVEVHAQEALLRPEAAQPTQARITILAPKVLQISAVHGGLNFSYREEFRNLPEGQTCRTYLEAADEPQVANGSAGLKAVMAGKAAYFMVAAGAAIGGVLVERAHAGSASGNLPESPYQP
jgi:hypothetical protein